LRIPNRLRQFSKAITERHGDLLPKRMWKG
jgi:hypothetical protein